MAKNKQNKPKGEGKQKASMTAMVDSNEQGRKSKNGNMDMQQNSKNNQFK